MKQKIVFFNVGWMENYNGVTKQDPAPAKGGNYNHENVGHEVCNFSENRGYHFGYVQPVSNKIRLENLGGTKQDEKVSGVTVVWVARSDTAAGTVVIGWYLNATVYRLFQKIPHPNKTQKTYEILDYIVSAKKSDCVLLPLSERTLSVPRGKGGIGQSNVWYASREESKSYKNKVVSYILNYYKGEFQNVNDVDDVDDEASSSVEGKVKLYTHLHRERDSKLVKEKKKQADNLCCEVCGFDFQDKYKTLGEDFCEVHHINPLSESTGEVKTSLADLAIVCSNCHRMLHRAKPALSIKELRKIVTS